MKKFEITNIKSIKKVRMGQIRIITSDNDAFAISVDNEDDFMATLQRINNEIIIE